MFNFGIMKDIFNKSTIMIAFTIVNITISTIVIVKFSLSLSSSYSTSINTGLVKFEPKSCNKTVHGIKFPNMHIHALGIK